MTRYAVDLLLADRIADVEITVSEASVQISFTDAGHERPVLVRSLVEQLVVEAGGTLRYGDDPTFMLPRPAPLGEVST